MSLVIPLESRLWFFITCLAAPVSCRISRHVSGHAFSCFLSRLSSHISCHIHHIHRQVCQVCQVCQIRQVLAIFGTFRRLLSRLCPNFRPLDRLDRLDKLDKLDKPIRAPKKNCKKPSPSHCQTIAGPSPGHAQTTYGPRTGHRRATCVPHACHMRDTAIAGPSPSHRCTNESGSYMAKARLLPEHGGHHPAVKPAQDMANGGVWQPSWRRK